MRALLLLMSFFSWAVVADASVPLNVSVSSMQGSVSTNQLITVNVLVTNPDSSASYTNVSTTVLAFTSGGSASASLVMTPSPVSVTIAPTGFSNFTWVYQGNGCGNVSFSAWATGFASTTSTAGPNTSSSVLVVCTPSPTPSLTPSFAPSPVVTATSTPWIIYGTATPGPSVGDATIPGNLFHPDQGQPLQLRFSAPLDSTVQIDLYNRIGEHIRHLEREVSPGTYTELWDGRNDQGLLVAAGIYVAQFKAKGLYKTVKFAVVK